MGDLLDWWRVYVTVLCALLGAIALLTLSGPSRLASLAAIVLVAGGLIVGLLWQASVPRRS